MAILSGHICDECGAQANGNGPWMKLQAVDLRDLKHHYRVLDVKTALDFCSPRCVLRWIAKQLEVLAETEEASVLAP